MENISWTIPVARVRKEERFATPVISMTALLKEGANRKFSFNKSAVAELGLVGKESFVAFGFPTDGTNDIFVKNLGTFEKDEKDAFIDVPAGAFNVAGNLSISDKRTFEFIVKLKGLNVLVENHLHLEQVEGKPYFRVSSVESDNQEAPTNSPSDEIVTSPELSEGPIEVEEVDPFDAATLAEPEAVIEAVPEVVVEAPKKVAKTVAKPVVEAPKVEAVVEDEWEEYVPEVEPVKNPKAVKFAIDDTEDVPQIPAPEVADEDVW